MPFLWLGIIALYFFQPRISNTLATIIFIGNLLLTGKYTKNISKIQARLSSASSSIKKYIGALDTVFKKKWKSKLLERRLASFESTSDEIPIKSLSSLSKIIDQLDYRLNFLVAIVANGLILWDLRIIKLLSNWKKENKNKFQKIFEHIGFMEAISSLSTWAYNNPKFCYPIIGEEYLSLQASKVSHPLIPASQNVENDFEINKKDQVIIITGSNMSGKSTFLRTIATNMILGYTGTKTTAIYMQMPVLNIVTYMRIKDALEENVSTFKAELNRISLILKILEKGENTFIIIDEMLRGTNSKDKLNGSIGITKKLLQSNAYSMIATHDIKLAELGIKESKIANYYFDIDYRDGDLVFDYKIKDGICKNFNASFLLGQLGIDTEVNRTDNI